MSRIHFDDTKEFGRWLQDRKADKYELYRLPNRTIAVPTVSTRPVLYGVCEERLPETVADSFSDDGYEPIYNVSDYRFQTEQAERSSDDE